MSGEAGPLTKLWFWVVGIVGMALKGKDFNWPLPEIANLQLCAGEVLSSWGVFEGCWIFVKYERTYVIQPRLPTSPHCQGGHYICRGIIGIVVGEENLVAFSGISACSLNNEGLTYFELSNGKAGYVPQPTVSFTMWRLVCMDAKPGRGKEAAQWQTAGDL